MYEHAVVFLNATSIDRAVKHLAGLQSDEAIRPESNLSVLAYTCTLLNRTFTQKIFFRQMIVKTFYMSAECFL